MCVHEATTDLSRLVFIDLCQERELLVINASLLVEGPITCESKNMTGHKKKEIIIFAMLIYFLIE